MEIISPSFRDSQVDQSEFQEIKKIPADTATVNEPMTNLNLKKNAPDASTAKDVATNPNAKKSAPDAAAAKELALNPNQIWVRISAAGMDFFDPKEHPNGLYESKERPSTVQQKHRVLPKPNAGQ